MRLWLLIWIAISVSTVEFVNSQDYDVEENLSLSTIPPTDGETSTSTKTTTTVKPTVTETSTTTVKPTITETPTTAGNHTTTVTPTTTQKTTTTGKITTDKESTTTENEQSTTAEQTTVGQVWAEFDVDCDSQSGYCYYKISAPQTLDTEAKNFSQEQQSFISASKATYGVNSEFTGSSIYHDYTQLVELFKDTKRDYDLLIETLNSTLSEASNINNSTKEAIDMISKVEQCYYDLCLRPTSTSTTTTPRQTTTPAVCGNYSCTTFAGYPGGPCQSINNKPICTCPGTLDQQNHCGPVVCQAYGPLLPPGNPGPIWSPGFNGTNTATANYGSNANCSYTVGDNLERLYIKFERLNLDSTAQLFINDRPVPLTNIQTFLDLRFNRFDTTRSFRIDFLSGTVKGSGYYYSFMTANTPFPSE